MSTERRTRAWVEVDGSAIRRNLRSVREAAGPGVALIPMVKADAYGLGAARAVTVLEGEEPWGYGVATVEEGRALRRLDVRRPILVVAPVPPDSVPDALEAGLTLALSDLDSLERLALETARSGKPAAFHVEVDTGMGRAGFDWRDAAEWAPRVLELAGRSVVGAGKRALRWEGCFTHFHSADEPDDRTARVQWRRLQDVVAGIAGRPSDLMIHGANSAAAFRSPELAGHAVRPGIVLYGGRPGPDLPVPEPVVRVRARVVRVRRVPPGTTLGYGATYRSRSWESWATVAIGYGDGLPRALGNRGHALVRGTRVPIIGRISMDLTVVDITGLEGRPPAPGGEGKGPDRREGREGAREVIRPGEPVTFLGQDGAERITPEEVATLVGTISYEIFTGLGARLPRVWLDHGRD